MIIIKAWKTYNKAGYAKSQWTGVFLFGIIPIILIRNK